MRALALAVALIALLAVLVEVRYAPPAALGADAPAERFSGARARTVQERLASDGRSRWIGSEGNRAARAVIVAELERSGWKVETQSGMTCTHYGMCATATNVVATLAGTEPALPGVLLSAHYDSVGAGPGASDDGVGTAAVIESARALAAGPRPRRNVVALLTDGEESGLLGADVFVREHPLAKALRATVNCDSRGSRGPSQMFETSRGNAWLARLMAEHLDRPVTTSLFYEVYRRMPNDTDFSVTKTIAGGVNFANTAGIEHYHTALDALPQADLGTLQHHGDHVLAMARAFADGEVGPRAGEDGDAVWFDVLALGIVRWPARWSMLFAIAALLLLLGRTVRGRAFDRGLAIFPVMVALGALAAIALGKLLAVLGALPAPWVAHALPARFAIEAGAVVALLAAAFGLARKHATAAALWSGVWLGWAALAVAAAAFVPGASYLLVVPALFAAVLGSAPLAVRCIAPAFVAAVLVLSLRVGLYEALGFAVAPALAVPALLLATTVAPLLQAVPRPWPKLIALAGAVVLALGAAAFVPKFSADHPQRVNVVYRRDDSAARVFVDTSWGPAIWGAAPPAMLDAIGGSAKYAPALPWSGLAANTEVPPLELAPPALEVLSTTDEGGLHKVKARVTSPRGAPTVAFYFPDEKRVQMRVEGRFAYPRRVTRGSIVGLPAVPPEGIMVELESDGPFWISVLDRTAGVPAGTKAEAAVHARPREATPFQDGDVTVVLKRTKL